MRRTGANSTCKDGRAAAAAMVRRTTHQDKQIRGRTGGDLPVDSLQERVGGSAQLVVAPCWWRQAARFSGALSARGSHHGISG